jgi:hypothetical protein
MFIVILKFASKKKDSYFKIMNIELLSINNVEKDIRYKFERLLDKRITLRNNKNRRKKIV